ncbi:MAG: transporter permease [Clostridiales bacterium]|jgi:ABC-2 type transport system permease protein|nr:transporter permease [Clostridiales bacterium]
MNIYKHELKVNLKSTIMWICVISGLASLLMLFYPILSKDMDSFMEILDNLPPAMKGLIGIAAANILTPLGYYGFAFLYTLLFGAIQSMNLGIGIVSKEEREKTADFLMTKPVTRVKILTAKLLSVLTIFIVTNIVYTIVTAAVVTSMADGDLDTGKFMLINLSLFLVQLIYFSIGLVISIAMKKIRSVLSISVGLVFMFFAISAFAVKSADDKLRFITPFQYFKTDTILAEGNYEMAYVITGTLIVIASIVTSYILYKRKDVHSV